MASTLHTPRKYPGVMVSGTYTDLVPHRRSLMAALQNAELFPIMMETRLPEPGEDVMDASLQMVRDSSGFVAVLGHRYGQIEVCPDRNPSGLSVTELEFDEALRLGRPAYVFTMGKSHLGLAGSFETDAEKLAKLAKFSEKARKHRIYFVFESEADFSRDIGAVSAKLAKTIAHAAAIPETLQGIWVRRNAKGDCPVKWFLDGRFGVTNYSSTGDLEAFLQGRHSINGEISTEEVDFTSPNWKYLMGTRHYSISFLGPDRFHQLAYHKGGEEIWNRHQLA